MLQIGEVAEQAGMSLRTVRYYEDTGLLEPAKRSEGGFRLYTAEHVERLALIRSMKPLGSRVQQMRELLDARDTLADEDASKDAREKARERLGECAELAATACERLREQLADGDGFVKQLRRESRRPRIAATRD